MALTDHVIVLDHLGLQVVSGPPTQSWEDTLRKLGMEEHVIQAIPPAARQQPVGTEGEAKITHSALDFHPAGFVLHGPWRCSCGVELHLHHDFVLSAWAKHVAKLEKQKLDADHLELHAVQKIDGSWRPDGKPRVVCRCGEWFESSSYFPDLAAWAKHVRAS